MTHVIWSISDPSYQFTSKLSSSLPLFFSFQTCYPKSLSEFSLFISQNSLCSYMMGNSTLKQTESTFTCAFLVQVPDSSICLLSLQLLFLVTWVISASAAFYFLQTKDSHKILPIKTILNSYFFSSSSMINLRCQLVRFWSNRWLTRVGVHPHIAFLQLMQALITYVFSALCILGIHAKYVHPTSATYAFVGWANLEPPSYSYFTSEFHWETFMWEFWENLEWIF